MFKKLKFISALVLFLSFGHYFTMESKSQDLFASSISDSIINTTIEESKDESIQASNTVKIIDIINQEKEERIESTTMKFCNFYNISFIYNSNPQQKQETFIIIFEKTEYLKIQLTKDPNENIVNLSCIFHNYGHYVEFELIKLNPNNSTTKQDFNAIIKYDDEIGRHNRFNDVINSLKIFQLPDLENLYKKVTTENDSTKISNYFSNSEVIEKILNFNEIKTDLIHMLLVFAETKIQISDAIKNKYMSKLFFTFMRQIRTKINQHTVKSCNAIEK